jgi:ubiquinone/menaquinone biosynthesis C-methylase UbiE/uncharacterized protein YbaR (Trm112 family)
MQKNVLGLLKCPTCHQGGLSSIAFQEDAEEIVDGVLWCKACSNWYPIEDRLLELLSGNLAYNDERRTFWEKHSDLLTGYGLSCDCAKSDNSSDNRLQEKQQSHFDWYADNSKQTYFEYEQKPFWLAADKIAFDSWRKIIQPGKWVLDIGCAEGRSTFKLMDLNINIVGFDISKRLVRQAINRSRQGNYSGKATFFAADATSLPFVDNAFDYVLIYGVLHHLPDPEKTCHEVARVLKRGGIYFGSENNVSIFRRIFDLLQKIHPIWHEEAGPEALISKERLGQFFQDTGVQLNIKNSVYLPPHLLNLVSEKLAYRCLSISDWIGQAIPFLRDNGGLILILGRKD